MKRVILFFKNLYALVKAMTREEIVFDWNVKKIKDSSVHVKTRLNLPCSISDSSIGEGTYISSNSRISLTEIGKYCSIGPNLLCGWGIHPINGISTNPIFYSTKKQVGYTLSKSDKIEERKSVTIGNDVFIGANVTILDGVTIGDGAVIGAGTVVSKNVEPYSVVVGAPMKFIRYRFEFSQINELVKIRWWDYPDFKLQAVEKYFFDIDLFISNQIID